MHETAENLKHHLHSAFGVPAHLKEAFEAWVASVEERLAVNGDESGGRVTLDDDSGGTDKVAARRGRRAAK